MSETGKEGDSGRVPGRLFCGIVAGEVPADIVHSTATTVAFKDISPAAPLHVLVVPAAISPTPPTSRRPTAPCWPT